MKKTIELDHELVDKMTRDNLLDYRSTLEFSLRDHYIEGPMMKDDYERHIKVIAALDVIIDELKLP